MKTKHILLLALLHIAFSSIAQDKGMAFLKGTPQSNIINPAFRISEDDKFYIAFPALGSTAISLSNTGFNWNDVFYKENDSLYIDINNLDKSLQDKNYMNANVSSQIIGFGFKAGEKSYITFDINAKAKTSASYPGSITKLRYGNYDYESNTPINHQIEGLGVDAMAYVELALGYNREITEKLTVGARLKYIMGAATVRTDRSNIEVITSADGSVTINNDILIQSSAPIKTVIDENGYVDKIEFDDNLDPSDIIGKNSGFGIDLGATYELNEKFTFGAAINDLGFINWKASPMQLSSKGSFHYDGADVTDNITGNNNNDQDLWDDIGDDLENSFKVSDNAGEKFTTDLMFNANLMATYQFKEWLDFGGMLRLNNQWASDLTLSASLNPSKHLSTVISYSINKNDFAELGAGLMVRGGCFQYYLMSDNINALMFPGNAKYASMRMGINFIF